MADFSELLEALRAAGEGGTPDGIYDDLTLAYQDATSTRDAKIAELTNSNDSLNSELSRAKAHNYDLLMSRTLDSGDGSGDGDGELSGDDDGEEDDMDLDALIKEG